LDPKSVLNICLFDYLYGVFTHSPYIQIVFILFILLIIISGLLYGSIPALISISNNKITLIKHKTDNVSIFIQKHCLKPQVFRNHILFFTTCINVIFAVSLFIMLPTNCSQLFYFQTFTLVISAIILFSISIPYIIGKKFPLQYLKFNYYILNPLIYVSSTFMHKFNKLGLFKSKPTSITENIAEALHVSSSVINDEKDIFEGIVKLNNTNVSSIMTPRVSIIAVEITTNFKDLLLEIINSGYSRIPIYSETLDSVKGILYVKDILPHIHKSNSYKWQTLIRPPYFIPESKKIDDLLEEFQKSKIHIAIVIDEYGGTCGIVSLKDILEEILGEMQDEFDDENDQNYIKIDENTYIFDGKISLNDVCKILQVQEDYFDMHKGDADSLAGLILEIKGDFPELFEEIIFMNMVFRIEAEDERRIQKIKITINSNSL